jgi:hypothetical protein
MMAQVTKNKTKQFSELIEKILNMSHKQRAAFIRENKQVFFFRILNVDKSSSDPLHMCIRACIKMSHTREIVRFCCVSSNPHKMQ